VLTVCDNTKKSSPVFPGRAERIHWSLEDPATVDESEDERRTKFRCIRDQNGSKPLPPRWAVANRFVAACFRGFPIEALAGPRF
jgi:hypothetical protein